MGLISNIDHHINEDGNIVVLVEVSSKNTYEFVASDLEGIVAEASYHFSSRMITELKKSLGVS